MDSPRGKDLGIELLASISNVLLSQLVDIFFRDQAVQKQK